MKSILKLQQKASAGVFVWALATGWFWLAGVSLVEAQGPVAWWQFEEADGTIASDSSGNGHDGALVGDASFDPTGGRFGGAVVLDGDGDAVEVPDADDLEFPAGQDFSITVWYTGPDTNTNDGLVSKGYGGNPRSPTGYYLLQVTDPGLFELDSRCCEGGEPRVRTGAVGPSLVDGSWHNVTVVRDYGAGASGEIRSYVDGELVHTISMTAGGSGDWNMGVNSDTLQIGNHFDRYTTGKFDEVALWDRALSEDEVGTVFADGVAGTLDAVALAFRPNPPVTLLGELTTLEWRVAPGASVSIDQGIGDVTAMTDAEGSGSVEVEVTEETTFTLTADDGVSAEQLQSTIRTKLIESFEASEVALGQGAAVALSWTVASVAEVSIDQGLGSVDAQTTDGVGMIEITPSESAVYTLTATVGGQEETAMVSVNIVDVTDGPVAYWPFDEQGGTVAADLSGSLNDHPATLVGGATFDPAGGAFGGAVVLDGQSGEVRVADHEDYEFAKGQDFSITVFFNSDGVPSDSNNGLVSKGYGDNPRSSEGYYLLQVTTPSQFEFDSRCCAGGTPRFRTGLIGPSLTDGSWHNVTVVRDYGTNEIRSYIDGNLEHTQVMNEQNGGDWNMGVNGEDLVIGDHLERFTQGKIDEVAIWRRVLTVGEISEISANGVAGSLGSNKLRLAVESAEGDSLTLRWESKGGKLYNIRSVIDPSSADALDWPILEGAEDLAATPPENVLTIPRPADKTRYFVIEEFNAPPVAVFADDFESGVGAWTTGSEGAAGTAWELGAPSAVGPAAANSGSNCFGTNLTANYGLNGNVWLRSPAIDLTGAGGATLRYAHYTDIETGFDFGRVAVLDAAGEAELGVLRDGIDGISDWEEVSLALPVEAMGKMIKIEFRFTSDELENFPGWYLDDVEVTVP